MYVEILAQEKSHASRRVPRIGILFLQTSRIRTLVYSREAQGLTMPAVNDDSCR